MKFVFVSKLNSHFYLFSNNNGLLFQWYQNTIIFLYMFSFSLDTFLEIKKTIITLTTYDTYYSEYESI